MKIQNFTIKNFYRFCNKLADADKDLDMIIRNYGYPPCLTRSNTFQTLVHIILEQQVSLESAYAAFKQLKKKIGYITAPKILRLSDAELKACYFSRQKTKYVRHLAEMTQHREICLNKMTILSDDQVRKQLTRVIGIGNWTVDVYLMLALQRTDLFPVGDMALMKSLRAVKNLPEGCSKEKMLELADQWRPLRSIAAMILWHYYLSK